MKMKKEYFVLAFVIIASSLYLFFYRGDKTNYQLPEIPAVGQTDISQVEISGSGDPILIEKIDNNWYIMPNKFPADENKIKPLLDALDDLTLTALISESQSYNRYSLDNENKIGVKAWSGETVKRDFAIGKAAPSYRHTFVVLKDDPRVYQANGNFRNSFELTVDKLRDKKVMSFDTKEIQELSISEASLATVFKRKEVTDVNIPAESTPPIETDASQQKAAKTKMIWEKADGQEAGENTINSLLAGLSNLLCDKYIAGKTKDDFKDAPALYVFRLKGTQEYTLSIFEKTDQDAKNYPAVSSKNDYPFLLPDWRVDNLGKNLDELLEKNEEPKEEQ